MNQTEINPMKTDKQLILDDLHEVLSQTNNNSVSRIIGQTIEFVKKEY